MAAESPRRLSRPVGTIVRPLPVSDKGAFGSVLDLISDYVQQPGSSSTEEKDKITWVKFAYADINECTTNEHKSMRLDGSAPPLLLILGLANGVQIWAIPANGEAQEVLSLRQGAVKTLVLLPTPVPLGSSQDMYLHKRPIVVMCDSQSSGQLFCTVTFVSLRTGDVVHSIKFKNPICNIYCNKKVIVITFQDRIAVFDACTFKDRFTISSCYVTSGPNINPIALGPNWLAYADQKLISAHQTCGGVAECGLTSYTATVIHAAMSISKSLAMFGETVASSFTGGGKPSHNISKKDSCSTDSGVQTQAGVVTIVDVVNVGEGEVNVSEENGAGIVAHFVAHVNEPVAALQFDHSGVLLATADSAGHRFHIFRILPHPSCSSLGVVHHLYTLNRGQTTATVQYISFSIDSRWIAVSTLRGTTHIFPITSYGGPVTVRTHTSPRVVNRLSRFHKSAGLEDMQHASTTGRCSPSLNNSPSSTGINLIGAPGAMRNYDSHPSISCHTLSTNRMGNPRLPPYPHPITICPLAKIKQSAPCTVFNYSSGSRSPPLRGAVTHQSTAENIKVATAFAPQRSWLMGSPGLTKDKEKRPLDCLYIVGSSGAVLEYILEPKPSITQGKHNDESSIDLDVQAHVHWPLGRSSNSQEVKPPLYSTNPLIIAQEFLNSRNDPLSASSARTKLSSSTSHLSSGAQTLSELAADERWLSQVEIITYAGPHRRLWQGPQFSFITYQHPANTTILSATSSALLGQSQESSFRNAAGFLTEDYGAESLHSRTTARSNPMAMPGGARHKVAPLIEAGSFDQNLGIFEVYGYSWPDSYPSTGGSAPPHYHLAAGGHHFQSEERPSEEQLRESLADAMLESPSRNSQCGAASSAVASGDTTEITSHHLMSGKNLTAAYMGGSGGNSEDQNWDTTISSSEELSTSSSHSGSASHMSDAALHSVDQLLAFPATSTPPSSPDVLHS